MALTNPWIITLGLVLLVVLIAFGVVSYLRSPRDTYTTGPRVSNTSFLTSTDIYKKMRIAYIGLAVMLIVGLVGSFISALVLTARPYAIDSKDVNAKKRDIIFCLDVSLSMDAQNLEITQHLKNLVTGLSGDRIGISVFNSSSLTFVPLTDDYDYIQRKLDELEYFFTNREDYYSIVENYGFNAQTWPDDVRKQHTKELTYIAPIDNGTSYHVFRKGGSLIGEGLATALYSFPYLDDSERSRIIIMSTDNQLNAFGEEIVGLDEASDLARKHDVRVYGIFPDETDAYKDPADSHSYDYYLDNFTQALEKTRGKVYVKASDQSVESIVTSIQAEAAKRYKEFLTEQKMDKPITPFIFLLVFTTLFGLSRVVLNR